MFRAISIISLYFLMYALPSLADFLAEASSSFVTAVCQELRKLFQLTHVKERLGFLEILNTCIKLPVFSKSSFKRLLLLEYFPQAQYFSEELTMLHTVS